MSSSVLVQEQVPPEELTRKGLRLRVPRRRGMFAVLGSGPAGLLATHALSLAGKEVRVFSLGDPSSLVGPQYLYQHIPIVTKDEPEGYVTQTVRGTMAGYRKKLYGQLDPGWVERPMAPGYDAWNLRTVYDRLWEMYESVIYRQEINPEVLHAILDAKAYARVISTIPPTAFCLGGHTFSSWQVLVADVNVEPIPHNTIVFNGNEAPSWHRESNIWGKQTTEWPSSLLDPRKRRSVPPVSWYAFEKPLRTNCDCFPEVVRMGRFGKWRNETWAHDAFNEAKELVK